MENVKDILELFLSIPLDSSEKVFEFFIDMKDAVICKDGEKKNFIYIPGIREDRVLLIAHADTVWDRVYINYQDDQELKQILIWKDGIVKGEKEDFGIGADDRAGCAMLYALRKSGHSLLITDGEEHGQISIHHMENNYHEVFTELNDHQYAIQLDRCGNNDYKVYGLNVSPEFLEYIETNTGYQDAGRRARTDIVALCKKICGVNFSIGYYQEHTPQEYLVIEEWQRTFQIIQRLIERKQKRFLLL